MSPGLKFFAVLAQVISLCSLQAFLDFFAPFFVSEAYLIPQWLRCPLLCWTRAYARI